jgi:hypothetical protein
LTKPLSRAVQERRAPELVEADDATRARWRQLDWFATPPWASRAGARLVLGIDPTAQSVWEPACGDGIMAECLAEYFDHVRATDIEPSYSEALGSMDFLNLPIATVEQCDWVITNPPFEHAAEFVRVGLKVAVRGVAVLCRMAFLESVDRADLHYGDAVQLHAMAPFSERVPMQLGPWNPKCSTATAYAWFVYLREPKKDHWPSIIPIRPGTRAALSRPGDIARFVKYGVGSLL